MKKIFLILGLGLFTSYLFFTYLLKIGQLNKFDLAATLFLQDHISRFFDIPFSLLSLFGSLEIVSIIMFVLWSIYKKKNYFFVPLFFGLFHIFELIGKAFITHPGPTSEFFRYYFNFSMPSSGVRPGSSFPSGHAGRTVFISLIIYYLISKSKLSRNHKRIIYIILFILNILMIVSRVYLGEHWLTDVMGGSMLGSSFAFLSLLLL
jgi:undecaprenyl-diphosphatase